LAAPGPTLTIEERDEVTATLDAVRGAFEALVVRGTGAAGPEQLGHLNALRASLTRQGANHLAGQLEALAAALACGRDAAAPLLRANATLRVFERVLTQDVVGGLLGALHPDVEAGPTAAATMPGDGLPSKAEQKKLLPVLAELGRAVLDLVTSGLTAASAATRQKLAVSSTEASRLKLNRLAPSLRYVSEEVERFLKESESFSPQRLLFFLTRAWLVLRGLERAIGKGDAAALADLLLQRGAAPVTVASLEVVTVGISKRVVQEVTSAFELRFRVLRAAGPLVAGQSLAWSFLRQLEADFSADALLHIQQAQGFRPKDLLGAQAIRFTQVAVQADERGPARLLLGPPSKADVQPKAHPWADVPGSPLLPSWDTARALTRLRGHRPSPLDLEVELEEEVLLGDWSLGPPRAGLKPDTVAYPVAWRGLELEAVASSGPEGLALRERLDGLLKSKKKTRPPLFGLVHYELGRLLLRPLSLLERGGPVHLMISDETVNLAELTRAIMKRG
jgi:hypothetical protein